MRAGQLGQNPRRGSRRASSFACVRVRLLSLWCVGRGLRDGCVSSAGLACTGPEQGPTAGATRIASANSPVRCMTSPTTSRTGKPSCVHLRPYESRHGQIAGAKEHIFYDR